MSNKHTPGPWIVRVLERGDVARHPKGYKTIVDLDQPNGIGQRSAGTLIVFGDEGEANARLIAAAPEMLEALKAMADFASNQLSPEGRLNALGKMDAAIRKAEGRDNDWITEETDEENDNE